MCWGPALASSEREEIYFSRASFSAENILSDVIAFALCTILHQPWIWSHIFPSLSFHHSLIEYISLSFFSPLFDLIYLPFFLFITLWYHIFSFLSFHQSLIEYIPLSFFSQLFGCINFPFFLMPIFHFFSIQQFLIAYISFFDFTLLPSLIKSRPHPQTSTQNDSTDISWSALKGFKLQNSWLKSSDEIFGQRGQGGCMCLLLWKCNAWAATFCGQV